MTTQGSAKTVPSWLPRDLYPFESRFAIRHFNAFVNVMIPMGVKRKKLDRRVMTAYPVRQEDAPDAIAEAIAEWWEAV